MRKISSVLLSVFALFALFALANGAAAADLQKASPTVVKQKTAAVPFAWTGIYGGLNVGYGMTGSDLNFDGFVPTSPDQHGVIGGAQVGYRWQIGPVVTGVEAQFDGSSMNGSEFDSTGSVIGRQSMPWLSTVNAQVGFSPMGNLLVYGTGGLASGQIVNKLEAPGFGVVGQQSKVDFGWDVGAGVEYALNSNWTTGLEYLHYDLGNSDGSFTTNPFFVKVNYHSATQGDLFRVKLNYYFGG